MDSSLSTVFMILMLIAGFLFGAIAVLYFQRTRGGRKIQKETMDYKKQEEENRKAEVKAAKSERIKDFMEFDSVDDDMIVQNNGSRYCMAIRCMGINYDLMSEPEMLAVEEGFSNFLNTLKFPIQLYVQSRTLDLSQGVNIYRKRLDGLKTESDRYIEAVQRAKATNPMLTLGQKQQMDYEVKKRRNLLDYGNDIVSYVERMSSNSSILQRKYYIIVSYETAEMGLTSNLSEAEAKDVAYSELYTRCKTIQAAIAPCGVESEILRSEDLAELLFIAYNKDDANVYNVKDAINNGIYRLYSTATSILDKKKAQLDAKLKQDAIVTAENALKTAMDNLRNASTVDISGLTEEEQYEDNTKREAMQIILDNQNSLDPEAVDMALEDLNNSMHQPLISKEELDAVDESYQVNDNAQVEVDETQVGADDINNLLNMDPTNGFIS